MKNVLYILFFLATLTSCAQESKGNETDFELDIEDVSDSIGYGHREGDRTRDSIDIIVVHSNYHVGKDPFSPQGCMEQFEQYDVAPHYLITRRGKVIQMVKEKDVAWHAGQSHLPGTERDSLNRSSIGIEIINTKSQGPNLLQHTALLQLCKRIVNDWGIRYVVRHSDIAPERKTDPWKMDWNKFEKDLKAIVDEELLFPRN